VSVAALRLQGGHRVDEGVPEHRHQEVRQAVSLPYQRAVAGDRALMELQRLLAAYGCAQFGTATDAERGVTMVSFKHRDRVVRLEASWKGYANALLKEKRKGYGSTFAQHEQAAIKQAQISVCSVLRDWVKGQITAIECGVLSFETAFMPHMLLPSGERVIDKVLPLLPAPPSGSS
jgi:hypothetical protein